MNEGARIAFLSGTSLCAGLPAQVVEGLARVLKPVTLSNGDTLIQQGDRGDTLYLIADGRFEVRKMAAGRLAVRARVGRGQIVGEVAVLSDEPRVCSVVAVRESTVLELSRRDFLGLVSRYPEFLLRVTRAIIARAWEPSPDTAYVATIAVIPQSNGVDVQDFTHALATELERFGRTCVLRTGDAGIARAEAEYDRVIYACAPTSVSWMRDAIREADLLLVVANANGNSDLSELEASALFGERRLSTAPVGLVLLRPDGRTPPRDTARWLDERAVQLHHHVATDTPADIARLARIITGNRTSLVLSGGGARGFGHIGVIRALQEAGIRIDFIGGTSMGANIGGLLAMGWNADRMYEAAHRLASNLKDPTPPLLSLFAGRKVTRALHGIFEEQQIEDLPTNFFAVSTDLGRAEEFVHRRGPLWLALRASSSLPGILPPVTWEGRCLVDGGVLNNLPVDVMAGFGPSRIIASDVTPQHGLELAPRPTAMVSGWRLLFERLCGKRDARDLYIGDVIARSVTIADARARPLTRARMPVALSLSPPVIQFGTLDFPAIEAIVEASYRYAVEQIQGWQPAELDTARGKP